VHSPDDANEMFDTLTYMKGASVLRMLEQYLGVDGFRAGIRVYLGEHANGNTETSDLWDALEEATGEPVRRIMDTWIWQGGFPLVSVSREDGKLLLGQRRFRLDAEDDDTRWEVPILVRHEALFGAEVEPVLIGDGGATVAHASDAVAVVNAGGHAFVRVRYTADLRERLLGSLSELPAVERYQLVDDAWATVMAGASSAVEFCRLAPAFGDETDLPVWQAVLQGLAWCERFLEGEPLERFRAFVRELVRPALDRVGWEAAGTDADLTKALRGALFTGLGVLGRDPETQALAREIEREARLGDTVDPSLASAAVGVIAASGGPTEFDAFVSARADASTPQEELRYLRALPDFREPALVDRALAMTLTDQIRPQSVPHVVAWALANRDQGEHAWGFLKARWGELTGRIAPSTVNIFFRGLRLLTVPGLVEDARAFFAEHPVPQSQQELEQALEFLRVGADLRKRATMELEAEFGA
jgi:puromycin-sensitive aminopeptidase